MTWQRIHFSAGGQELWDLLSAEYEMDPPTTALVVQLCRIVDNMDRLSAALRSNGTWFSLANDGVPDDDGKIRIVVDGALSEYRQHATTFANILTKLGVGKLDRAKSNKPQKSTRSDDLAKQLEAQFAQLDEAKDSQQSG